MAWRFSHYVPHTEMVLLKRILIKIHGKASEDGKRSFLVFLCPSTAPGAERMRSSTVRLFFFFQAKHFHGQSPPQLKVGDNHAHAGKGRQCLSASYHGNGKSA